MRSHLKVYFDFEVKAKEYDDEEKGRLLLAMLRYAKDGTEGNLTGNERFVFPVFKAQIDEEIKNYETKVKNGTKGGRPVINQKPEETENNLTEPEETETAKKEERRKKKEDKRESIGRFTPPTIEQVTEYCRERNNDVPPEKWFNYYTANGWKVGKNPMKDWKAAVRTWEKGGSNNGQRGSSDGGSDGKIRSAYSFLDEQSGAV
jgi:hypothetical protein